MSGARASLGALVTMAWVAAATTWVALLSWRGFTEQPGRFLGPLFVLGIVVAAVGVLTRSWRAPAPVVVLAQLIASGVVFSAILTGAPLPVGAAWGRLVTAFTDAVDTANRFAPPVPSDEGGVYPLLIAGGLGCILLVDALACTARRVPLAGLPLLTVYSVPVSMLGGGLTWWIFAITAAGFLTMLFLHESEQVSRWGRALNRDDDSADPDEFGVRTGAVRASAGAIGGVVTALAIFVPVLIPTLSFHVFEFGNGPGGDGDISIQNPLVDLRRDLKRDVDVPLLEITTDDPNPSYMRIGVLTRFTANEWSSGDRDVPSSNRASGPMPRLDGVSNTISREEFDYHVRATDEFRSTWLPTQPHISRIEAPGDWRYDEVTMDFLASDDDLDTAGLEWTFTAVQPSLESDALARAASPGTVEEQFLELPSGIDSMVRNLALQVTREAPTRFEKAVALQTWFRETGGFTYDDSANPGSGGDDLVEFLEDDASGRTGYCEQFAAAMAVMARQLGIPARVAVGFLTAEQTGQDTYVYSAHDMHSWPELYFPGGGWVRFEPTPPDRAGGVPGYTTDPVTPPDPEVDPSASGSEGVDEPLGASPNVGPREDQVTADEAAGAGGSGVSWAAIILLLLALAVVVAAVVGPRTIRGRRRERRLEGGPEEAWLELRDTVVDLGMIWPPDRSPRQTRSVLVRYFGAPVDDFTAEVPRRGPDTNPDAVTAVDSIVHALERRRYARAETSHPGAWRAEVQTCAEALYGGAPRAARRRATWLPRSVFRRTRPVRTTGDEAEQVEVPAHGRVIDHVG